MRLRLLIALTLISILVSLATISQSRTTAEVTAPARNSPQVKRKTSQPDPPGTVSGASNPDAIPDTVAYELFMRSISDYPSESVFEGAGLSGDQIANVLSYVRSFELAMSLFDQDARKIKKLRSDTGKLDQLQKKKQEYLERGLNHYLPMILGADGASKIRSYVAARVKPKTKKLPATTAQKDAMRNRLAARHHAPSAALAYGAYVYCNAWHDGEMCMAQARFHPTMETLTSISLRLR